MVQRKPNDNPVPIAILSGIIFAIPLLYLYIAWAAFFYRQPHLHELDALTHPIHVLTFQRVEE